MSLLLLGGALVAILALVGTARLLRLGRDARIGGPEEVAAATETALAGFAVIDLVVGADGAGALAVGQDGRLAAIKLHGTRPAVREVRWSAVRASPEGTVIETGERRLGAVTLKGVDALDLRRLAALAEGDAVEELRHA
ncbi:MAG: cell wall anchor protein [Sphingomonas bacterium]|uniref:hypothetical protein n=1 Tax=Sphingomonas bacterium TaxID=1895847 RepID=UPI002616B5B5|nr:hypothetical protein [Sphingomonas bacterium]MDB5697142.1 cell wall anchor protein [Sphingomonas bacterium]